MKSCPFVLGTILCGVAAQAQAAEHVVFLNNSSLPCKLRFSNLLDQRAIKPELRLLLSEPGKGEAITKMLTSSGEVEVPCNGGQVTIDNGPGEVPSSNSALITILVGQGKKLIPGYWYEFSKSMPIPTKGTHEPAAIWFPRSELPNFPAYSTNLLKYEANGIQVLELKDPDGKAEAPTPTVNPVAAAAAGSGGSHQPTPPGGPGGVIK